YLTIDPGAPLHSRGGGEMGSVRARLRTGHRIFGTGGPGGAARTVRSAGPAGRPRRCRSHGGGRRLPGGHGIRNAALRGHGDGHRPSVDGTDRARHSRDDPLPPRQATGVIMASFTDVLTALAPPLGLAILFTIAIRAMIHADRRERRAQARAEAQMAQLHAEKENEA